MKRNRPTEAHSHTEDGRGRNLVRTQKETDQLKPTHSLETAEGGVFQDMGRNRPRRTHFLETVEGGTCQETERNRPTEARSHPGDERGRGLSGHGKKPNGRGALTNWRRQREEPVRTQKESDQSRCTHILETAEGGTCQDTERNGPTEAHSLPGDSRGRDLSGYKRKPTD